MRNNQKGMTLVEIIIVIALIGILAGSSVVLIGHIGYANTKKTVESIDVSLDKLQSTAMSKKEKQYLYIYKRDDGYYMKQLSEKLDVLDSTKLDGNGTKISGKDTEIHIDSPSGTIVESDTIIRIKYTRSGVFDTDTNVNGIVIEGKGSYTITLVKETGKHPIS